MPNKDLRRQIDELDRRIVELLNERAACAHAIGEAKVAQELAAFAPAREQEVLRAVGELNRGPLPAAALDSIYRAIINACRALERPLRISYWGPPASNTHVAARDRFGPQATYQPAQTVADVFAEVEKQRADYGVVPVENSTEGVVNLTLDMFLQTPLRICAETYVHIHHNFLSRAGSLSEIRRVYTMPQATAQCRTWLCQELPGAELVDVSTTARAAAIAADEPDAGAIGNHAASQEYELAILAENIEDNPRNRTRFLVVGNLEPPPTGKDKTSIVFSVPHQAGALARALAVFDRYGVSLTMIESRPTKITPWESVFYIDVKGHAGAISDNASLRAALPDFERACLFVQVLGSYPEA